MTSGAPVQLCRAGVLGSPIAHSLSPLLHEAGYAVRELTSWRYTVHEVSRTELAAFLAELDHSWRGVSLTMPLKEAAFEVASTVTPLAEQARSINTLIRRADGGWDATNTDVAGIVGALAPVPQRLRQRPAVVVGTGATARSAVLALAEIGVPSVRIAGRTRSAVAAVVSLARDLDLVSEGVRLEEWPQDDPGIIVSTVPANASESVAAAITSRHTGMLLDVVYANWPTPLANAATEAGLVVVSGLDMLVHQAAVQFELFTGVAAPVQAMLRAGRAALSR